MATPAYCIAQYGSHHNSNPILLRDINTEELTEEIQAKPEISELQRKEEETEAEIQQSLIQKQGEAIGEGEASTELDSEINSARGGGQPLDPGLQQSMGQAMGADFSGVSVHTDAQSDELNQSIQAKALQMTRSDQVATSSTSRTSMSLQRRKRVASLFSVQRKSQNMVDLGPKMQQLKNLHERANQIVQRVPIPVGTGGKAYFDGDIPANLIFLYDSTVKIENKEKQVKVFSVEQTETKVLFEPLTGLYYNSDLKLIPARSIVNVREEDIKSGLDSANRILKDFCEIIKSDFVQVSELPATAINGKAIKRLLIQVAIPDLLQLIQEAGRKKIADPNAFMKAIDDLIELAKTTPTTQPELLQLLSDITVKTSDMLVKAMPETPKKDLEKMAFIHDMENKESAGKGSWDLALNELAGEVKDTKLDQPARKKIVDEAYHLGFNPGTRRSRPYRIYLNYSLFPQPQYGFSAVYGYEFQNWIFQFCDCGLARKVVPKGDRSAFPLL